MDMLTFEDFEKLKNEIDKAENDDTPYMGVVDEEIHIIGDPNKTEVKPRTYVVQFGFPDNEEFRKKIERNGDKLIKAEVGSLFVERTYRDIYVTPRNVGKANTAFVLLQQFYYNINDDGEVRKLTEDEAKLLFNAFNGEIGDATYEVCQAVLKIPQEDLEWMLPLNAMQNAVQMVANNPNIVNSADLFFGSSLEKMPEQKEQ